ncbi:alcohol-forming fatty acyl-CoA reductase-like [Gossypium australe]|uniref:Alcohol-forming fatty acyl-CoA reductase-like n=1 Tax=Gossypium australe TaxID=47621 RepID=A0A5B6USI8_9ROSI|nr:alcohol-forming fatty acyl-CoA reductase-like [Gossypium australe]
MYWLVECVSKRVTLKTTEGREIDMVGKRRDYLYNLIFAMVVEKLVRKGCEAYLAFVMDRNVNSTIELSRLPPDREVEFGIKLLLGTTLVSIAPYLMAPKELQELKIQLQNF